MSTSGCFEFERTRTRPDEVSAARVARHQQQAVRVAPADVEPAAVRRERIDYCIEYCIKWVLLSALYLRALLALGACTM